MKVGYPTSNLGQDTELYWTLKHRVRLYSGNEYQYNSYGSPRYLCVEGKGMTKWIENMVKKVQMMKVIFNIREVFKNLVLIFVYNNLALWWDMYRCIKLWKVNCAHHKYHFKWRLL